MIQIDVCFISSFEKSKHDKDMIGKRWKMFTHCCQQSSTSEAGIVRRVCQYLEIFSLLASVSKKHEWESRHLK